MIDSVFNLLGLDYSLLDVSDDILFIALLAVLLFVISETFRILELVVSRLTKKR